MILSASGWRDIFAADNSEESCTKEISATHKQFAYNAAFVFSQYLLEKNKANDGLPVAIIVGMDTRPTGPAIANSVISAISDSGVLPLFVGITAAPEIMALAKLSGRESEPLKHICGFIFITASHNPIGHNGLKFGLTDGGVLEISEAENLLQLFNKITARAGSEHNSLQYISCKQYDARIKNIALNCYKKLTDEIVLDGSAECAAAIKDGLQKNPIGICADFNGSARTLSIDRDYFASYGIKFRSMNDVPGEIVHKIVPEDDALDPCCRFLERLHESDPSFVLGYVPDCDGDRGNLVIYDKQLKTARALEAQEVFALALLSELAFVVWKGEKGQLAVAVNDPTSMRVDAICAFFGAEVHRAEVGEANVVGLGRELRESGKIVRIVGEGSAGGNITHPSSVRDPLDTVMALVKLLAIRSTNSGKKGLFEIWCEKSGKNSFYKNDFTLTDVLASLPQFWTTGTYSEDAVLKIAVGDHTKFKADYQKIFLQEWDDKRDLLKTNFGIVDWEAAAYNGITERCSINDFSIAQRGGLKIYFKTAPAKPIAAIWMRGSATEPVFRIMADANNSALEHFLIKWQHDMVMRASAFGNSEFGFFP